MQNEPAAAAQASPPKEIKTCAHCGAKLEQLTAHHVCDQCQVPQPIEKGEDFFSIFGLERKFRQDRAELEKRFYQLSRVLHPDRFSTADQKAKDLSLQRMSFVNQAYQNLRDPSLLRDYILELEGIKGQVKEGQKKQSSTQDIPMEIAEAWFEIQELIEEKSPHAQQKLEDFEDELNQFTLECLREIGDLEDRCDLVEIGPQREELLKKISQRVDRLNYLKSIRRDVGRIDRRMD